MKLIVGLGNPGRKYRDTRHNVGFAVVDELAGRDSGAFESAPAEALLARVRTLGDGGTLLVKPLTMMNASGFAVSEIARYFRVAFDDILVVADDVNLPLGRLRARPGGSAGGHNGFRSIIEQLGTTGVRAAAGGGRPRRPAARPGRLRARRLRRRRAAGGGRGDRARGGCERGVRRRGHRAR